MNVMLMKRRRSHRSLNTEGSVRIQDVHAAAKNSSTRKLRKMRIAVPTIGPGMYGGVSFFVGYRTFNSCRTPN